MKFHFRKICRNHIRNEPGMPVTTAAAPHFGQHSLWPAAL